VYVAGIGPTTTYVYGGGIFEGSGWGGKKALWIVDPGMAATLTVRAIGAFSQSNVRFDHGGRQLLDRLTVELAGLEGTEAPSYLRFRRSGCYHLSSSFRNITQHFVFLVDGPVIDRIDE
jgi:hypothetical protein